MALIDKRLSELKLSREIVDVYRDHLDDESLTGVVSDFSNGFLYMGLVTDEGENNGISVVFREDISRIRVGGNVSLSIKQLMQVSPNKMKFPDIDLKSRDSIIASIQTHYGYVTIHTEYMDNDICFIGEVLEQDGKWLSLLCYGTVGHRDTYRMLLDKSEISRVDAGGKYEESIKLLAEKTKK